MTKQPLGCETKTAGMIYDPRRDVWFVHWWGTQHGGEHQYREDAIDHAERLEASEDWDHANWREMTGSAEYAP